MLTRTYFKRLIIDVADIGKDFLTESIYECVFFDRVNKNMTYTKRQISEAIAYWKNQLKEMNETETSSVGDVDNKKRL